MMLNRFFRREPDLHTRSAEDQALIDGLKADVAAYARENADVAAKAERYDNESRTKGRLASELLAERNAAYGVLRGIIAEETSYANATVKRIVKLAKAGLPDSVVEGVS